MDGFSYNNIFETKGTEYLVIIGFLLVIIPFWFLINRKGKAQSRLHGIAEALSANILKIPGGVYFNRNHTWTYLSMNGIASMGIDDFLVHATGPVTILCNREPGDLIRKGEPVAEIVHGERKLSILSPVSGEIIRSNSKLVKEEGYVAGDPCGKGWIYRIKPSEWITETGSCIMAEEAMAWAGREIDRLKDFLAVSVQKYMPAESMLVLQDGGELIDSPLSDMPAEIWYDFQKSFLN